MQLVNEYPRVRGHDCLPCRMPGMLETPGHSGNSGGSTFALTRCPPERSWAPHADVGEHPSKALLHNGIVAAEADALPPLIDEVPNRMPSPAQFHCCESRRIGERSKHFAHPQPRKPAKLAARETPKPD